MCTVSLVKINYPEYIRILVVCVVEKVHIELICGSRLKAKQRPILCLNFIHKYIELRINLKNICLF